MLSIGIQAGTSRGTPGHEGLVEVQRGGGNVLDGGAGNVQVVGWTRKNNRFVLGFCCRTIGLGCVGLKLSICVRHGFIVNLSGLLPYLHQGLYRWYTCSRVACG